MTEARHPREVVAAMGAPPTDEQWRAISMPLEPYVVVAGAGSGKTSVVAARVVYLGLVALGRVRGVPPEQGVLPGNVLCLTFTNKATENLTLRIARALSAVELPEGEEPTILNYHGFAAQILDRHGLRAGIEPGLRILSNAQRIELCGRVLDEMTFEHVNAEWQPTLLEKILSLAEQAANHRVSPERIAAFAAGRLDQLQGHRSDRAYVAALERIELAEAVARFRDLKRRLGVIDFGDQITLALDVVERFPAVVEDYRTRYRTAVLDEYQDTNVAQADLLSSIFGGGFPITAVGDPDQNIYAWRGASLFNLLQFPTRFPRSDGTPATRLPLYTNFRSGARILAAADAVIQPVPVEQRGDPEKMLVPWEPNGEGRVAFVRHLDEWTEARWIADGILDLHARDPSERPWSSFAVLCRKSRLFVPVQEALGERSIPVEIVGLAGLLKLPEVVEVLAYARAVADPMASVALARILLGPRYRVGFKDLARVAGWAKERNYGVRGEEKEDEAAPFLFAEALEHLDEVALLSEEGRARLEEFRAELAALRAEAGGPVGEFLAHVIRRTGIAAELDAALDVESAAATRRNLAGFLDEVHAFSPLEGELTLRAFLDYVDTVEAGERPEWSPVQPSEENSVKVMTVHQAKGLEFDIVFVPGLAKGILPDLEIQQNPAERGKSMDFELRGDRDLLPSFRGNLNEFRAALRDQEMVEERRTCYVALTRARQGLFVTGAHWYGEGVNAKDPSVFLDELAAWGESTALAEVDRGPGDSGEENPLVGYRDRFVRDWPGPALRVEPDELFPQGWRKAASLAAEDPAALDRMVASLDAVARGEYRTAAEDLRAVATHLREREGQGPAPTRLPSTVSVGGLVDFARCPKRFYWSTVQPIPRFSGPAARLGTQIHRWIERRSSGQASLLEMDEAPDLAPEETSGRPGKLEALQRAFLESRFAGDVPLFAERPFILYVDGFAVAGRIDAIFGAPGGRWEVVDYKTGQMPPPDDPLSGLQLDLYGLACTEIWGKAPEDLSLTYLYLATGQEVTRPAGDIGETRRRLTDSLAEIAAGRFEPSPGPQCRWCDFLPFCQAGQAYMESGRGGGIGKAGAPGGGGGDAGGEPER